MNTDYRPYTTLTEVPEDIFITIRVRMYALGALVWDYVDTVLDIARSMRRHELKKTMQNRQGTSGRLRLHAQNHLRPPISSARNSVGHRFRGIRHAHYPRVHQWFQTGA